MEESISKFRENSISCLRLPILHPWKRIAVLRCVSVFDSILWTRCLLQRLNVSSGFSVFKVILAFVCFSFVSSGITVNSFCFLAVPFRKNFKEICEPGTTFLQSCNVFSFFVLLCSLNCMNPTTTRVLLFYPHRPLFLSIDKDILFESQRNLMKKGLTKKGPLFLRLSTKISHDCYVAQNISLVFFYKYVYSET